MDRQEASKLIETLFHTWGPCLVRYAYRLTWDREAADDLVQESFLALYQALRSGMEIENPRAWTLVVVRRLVAVRRRNQARRDEALLAPEELAWIEDPRRLPGDDEEPDAVSLLHVLSAREREVVLMRIEGRKYREIADALRISRKTVETLLARALKKLRKAAGTERTGQVPAVQREEHVPKTLQ